METIQVNGAIITDKVAETIAKLQEPGESIMTVYLRTLEELLDEKLSLIADRIEDGAHPLICFTVFVPDERKSGGRFEQVTDRVYRIDGVHRQVVLESRAGRGGLRKTLDIDRITAIRGEAVDAP